jgi:hypothetical protein
MAEGGLLGAAKEGIINETTFEPVSLSIELKLSNNISFLICNFCYWCASNLGIRKIIDCPGCNNRESLESIWISQQSISSLTSMASEA